ncbi:MAG: adenosylmethionine--8-amino-7-oxononanoate transaminase [Pirellulales bacterium]
MPTLEQLCDWDQRHYWHAFTQMADYRPLVIEKASGCWLYDTAGKRYLDGVSSLWCNVHGHRHPRIDAAIRAQLDSVAHCTSLGLTNPTGILLAKRLADLSPGNLQHVFFACDGSNAVEVALKMAFQYWQQCERPQPKKTTYVALGDAYHGDTLGSTSVGGIPLFHAIFSPLLFDVLRVATPDAHRLPANVTAETACSHYLQELEQLLAERHEEIAAVVIEPLVQGAAGMILHPDGYLRGVRQLTRQYDVLLIADEIVTAFGRSGQMFACNQEQVVPDLMCLGKGITGGYLPLAATLATEEVYSAFLGPIFPEPGENQKTFFHGHTYGGNPLAAAAALASLDVLEEEGVLEKLPAKSAHLAKILAACQSLPQVESTRQLGMLAAIDMCTEHRSDRWEASRIAQKVCQKALEHNLWIRPLGGTLIIVPPLAIDQDELEHLEKSLIESIVDC